MLNASLSTRCCDEPAATPPPQALRLSIYGPGDPGRAEVEAFIARVFAERFDARISEFAPTLVGLCDAQQGLVAAAGYRSAETGPLFLERYLSGPVEGLLPEQAGRTAARRRIVEVGHLAAARSGEGRRLIRLLAPHLAGQGFDWVVSTLTEELRQLFLRIGVTPLALGAADPRLIGGDAEAWGRYYEHAPVVLAGNLPQALQQLARRSARAGA